MTRTQLLKDLKYVFWKKEANPTTLSIRQMRDKCAELENAGNAATTKTLRQEWREDGTYRIEERGYYRFLYVKEKGEYKVYVTHMFNDAKNLGRRDERPGADAARIEQKLFKKLNGVDQRTAFGFCDRALMASCVPKQLYYIAPGSVNRNILHAGKADFSSHYPASICGRLPNWKKSQTIEGTAAPSPDYPFAFYVRSGHSAEYAVYDTHDWLSHKLAPRLFGDRLAILPTAEDLTILCPASDYELTDTVRSLYDYKQRGELVDGIPAKAVLNCSIGYKHLANINAPQNRLDHLAAVAIARANQKMIDIFDRMPGQVLQIVVDCVIYKGAGTLGRDAKDLGQLYQEVTDAAFRMRGINQYIFIKNGSCPAYASSGLNDNIKTTCLEDINAWRKTETWQEEH